MKLIAEYQDQEISYMTEATENGGKNHVIEGIFAQAESKNRNGRIYPKAIMEKAIDKYNKEQVIPKSEKFTKKMLLGIDFTLVDPYKWTGSQENNFLVNRTIQNYFANFHWLVYSRRS